MTRWVLLFLAGCAAPPPVPQRPETPAKPGAASSPGVAGEGAATATGEPPGGADTAEAPASRPSGPLTQDSIRAVVRASYDTMTACYLQGLKRDPSLGGTIEVHLVIDDHGNVVGATAPKGAAKRGDERLLDAEVVGCVERAFMKLAFPPTGRGMLTFTYPVVFHLE